MKGQLRLLGGRKLDSPRGLMTRPTPARVREAVMNFLGEKIEGCHWLDLCSGSGVMACEALQKGVKRILAIEKQRATAQICKLNLIDVSESKNIMAEMSTEDQNDVLNQMSEEMQNKFR